MKSNCKFYLVDDSLEFRQAMKLFVEQELGGHVIGEVGDGKDALEDENIQNADIILMDIMMKNIGGIQATKDLLNKYSKLNIIAVSNSRDELSMHNIFAKGFKGYIQKNKAFEELPLAIEKVQRDGYYCSKGIKIDQ